MVKLFLLIGNWVLDLAPAVKIGPVVKLQERKRVKVSVV